uniref:7TM_GPCR_Srx domain-containing protein n=1 Tax=Rhabditophanes sp. KR3021 TaxID=114890 RepID=A0AC35U2E3_9BILA
EISQNIYSNIIFSSFCFTIYSWYFCSCFYYIHVDWKFFERFWFNYNFFVFFADCNITNNINFSVLTSYFSFSGFIFCNRPRLIFYTGQIVTGGWANSNFLAVSLAISRFLNMYVPNINIFLFDKNRTWIWIILSVLYGLGFGLFTPPCDFQNSSAYINYPLIINNIIVITLLSIFYIMFFLSFYLKSKDGGSEEMSNIQRNLLIQTSLICSLTYLTGIIYQYASVFPVSADVPKISHFCWILGSGSTAVALLTINKTVRAHIYTHYLPKCLKLKNVTEPTLIIMVQSRNK